VFSQELRPSVVFLTGSVSEEISMRSLILLFSVLHLIRARLTGNPRNLTCLTDRPGARFGPSGIRQGSRRLNL